MQRYLIECIGTFFLVFTVAFTGNPFAIGAMLTALVYMGGYISGAHYNPAVTLAVLLRGKIERNDAIRYMLAQVLGGCIAALLYWVIKGSFFIPKPGVDVDFLTALAIEIICTFVLAFVILQVATSKQAPNQFFGLAIGSTLLAIATIGGPISGGVYNPAVALGPLLLSSANISHIFLYLLGPFTGGALAAFVFKYTTNTK